MELIDREALKHSWLHAFDHREPLTQCIDEQPAIDAVPVVHGRWVKHDGYTECSECKHWYDSAESEDAGDRSNYYPSCGARTDGEEAQQ